MIALTTAQDRLSKCEPERCPVCGEWHSMNDDCDPLDRNESIEAAAHCCLWKHADHPTRSRIASRLQTGANWLEATQAEGVSL